MSDMDDFLAVLVNEDIYDELEKEQESECLHSSCNSRGESEEK